MMANAASGSQKFLLNLLLNFTSPHHCDVTTIFFKMTNDLFCCSLSCGKCSSFFTQIRLLDCTVYSVSIILLPQVKMKTSSAIKVLDGKTRAVYKGEFLESN